MVRIHPDPPTNGPPPRARIRTRRGHSSAGRAPALQAGGHRFDPGWLHQQQESEVRGQESVPRNAALISDPSCASTIGCSLTIWIEGSCPRERDVVMTSWVAWTGLCIASCRCDEHRGDAQAREFPMIV